MSDQQVPAIRIESHDNPLLRRLRRLLEQPQAYRRLGQYWIEGEHLCAAARRAGIQPAIALCSESALPRLPTDWQAGAPRVAVVADAHFAAFTTLPSPAGFGYLVPLAASSRPMPGESAVVLDRLQDAGNVGSVLRSAAAFGFRQVLALAGTAGLWSPKVLRAAQGAHFSLHLVESLDASDIGGLGLPLLATSSHGGAPLHRVSLPWPCAWMFGNEGQGLAPGLASTAFQQVRIEQPGGQESLNVAAAAAICLHASATQARERVPGGHSSGGPSL